MNPGSDPERPPQVVIVGRQNVGKSTLFNRITSSRRSIVGDLAGMTRDRIRMPVSWKGRLFELTDTGGMVFRPTEQVSALVSDRVHAAIRSADHLVFVVDGRTELTPTDWELADLLRRSGRPVTVAVNKCDTPALDVLAAGFGELGFASLHPVSAEHGRGIRELLADLTAGLGASTAEGTGERAINVAILGRPNVGKSTLLNTLVGDDTAIVSAQPGTTRDAVDARVSRRGTSFVFVDTAGIRRKGKTRAAAEKLSVVMARRHLRMADVALVLVDVQDGVTAQDSHIAGYAHEAGKPSVVVVNKWDLTTRRARHVVQDVRRDLKMLRYAPVALVSAITGKRVGTLFPRIEEGAAAARRRIPTAELNRFLAEVDLERVTVKGGRKPKLSYVTQVAVAPPTFLFFTGSRKPFHFGLERYLANQIRARFDFRGTPITIRSRRR